jgi:hypothetical protein
MTPVYSGNSSLPLISGWKLRLIAGIATDFCSSYGGGAGRGNEKESRGSNLVLLPRAAPKCGSFPLNFLPSEKAFRLSTAMIGLSGKNARRNWRRDAGGADLGGKKCGELRRDRVEKN